MTVHYGHSMRVFVRGVEISDLVQSFDIRTEVGSVTRTTLVLFGSPAMDHEGIHIGSTLTLQAQSTDAPRAIHLRDDA